MSEDGRFGGSSGTPAGGKPADRDYGFFAAGPVAAPSQFGGPPSQFGGPPAPVVPPARAMPPPLGAVPAQPAPNQFGPPPVAPLAPFGPVGAPPGYYPPPYAPVQRRGLPAWAIVAICVPAAFVVLGILAAIAIPVFLSQRDKAVAAATTVSMPDQVNGMHTSTDAALRQQVQGLFASVPTCGCFDQPVTSIYSDAANTHVVIAGAAKVHSRFSAANQAAFVRGFWKSARSSSGAVLGEAREQDTGRLGGTMSCAPLAGGATGQICIAVDAGSFFFITDSYRDGIVDPGVPRMVREAVVHRN